AIAAGNDGVDISSQAYNLANLSSLPNVIAVGAEAHVPESDYGLENAHRIQVASYSNGGSRLTLMGPSGDNKIGLAGDPASDINGKVQPFSGTSAAAPNVAAIASLVWSAHPVGLTADDVKRILDDTAMGSANKPDLLKGANALPILNLIVQAQNAGMGNVIVAAH